MAGKRNDTQEKILEYIEQSTHKNGYPPSVREICEAIGLKSTSTVHGHLVRLEKKGKLNRTSMRPRAITVPVNHQNSAPDTVRLPVLGKVAAGIPITAIEDYDDFICLPKNIIGTGEHFVLTVKGESMIEAGILDGDYLVIRRQSTAENGEIVVAMIDDEATVKRYYKENGHYRLQPENSTMEPIIVPEVTILGKVVLLYRNF